MKRAIAVAACVALPGVAASSQEKWTTIVDGKTMGDFGQWNTYDITATGDHFVVLLNGQKTVDVTDKRLLDAGPIALQ